MPDETKDFWFPFYPSKWMSDAALRRTSKRARATWMDILCLMFDAESKGVLRTGHVAWSLEEIASTVPGNAAENLEDIEELLARNVASREDGTGALMCRLMFKAGQLSELRRAAGKMGGRPKKANQKQNESKVESKTITKPLTIDVVSSSSPKEGVQGESGGPPSFVDLIPEDLYPLLQSWFPRIGSYQLEMVGQRVHQYGVPRVRQAIEISIRNGNGLGKLGYIDTILKDGVREQPKAEDLAQQGIALAQKAAARRQALKEGKR